MVVIFGTNVIFDNAVGALQDLSKIGPMKSAVFVAQKILYNLFFMQIFLMLNNC